ncbi:MAG TPA: LysR family transcriptional regulator [Steroidobacteraceae bacterium]
MLDEMRALVAVAEEGSIGGAAQRICLTQPAVTRQIQRLEQMLSVTLLDRRQKPPTLTPAGLHTVERCRAILAAVSELKASASSAVPQGVLRVGIIHPLADSGLAPIISILREHYPQVSLRIHGGWTSTLLEQLQRGMLDAAVVLADPVGGEDAGLIAQDHFNVVAARTLKLKSSIDLEELDRHDWVLSPEPCTARAALASALKANGKTLRVTAEVQDSSLQLALIGQGLGLGFFPSRYAAVANAAGLDMLEIRELACPFVIRMERRADLHSLAPVVDRLQAEMRARVLFAADEAPARGQSA